MTQLFDAIKAGDAAAVDALIGADAGLVNAVDSNGTTAFAFAVYNRQDDIAALLKRRGAAVDIYGASMSGDEPRLRALLAADPSLAAQLSHDGWTPLHLAAFFGHTACARALIEHGAPVNERTTNPMQNLPIHAAVAGRSMDIVALLIENGAAVNARQHGGWTALHAAAQNGDSNIVQLLIGSGADVRARADNQQSPLDLAMLKGHQEIVDLLEHYGAAA